MSKIDTIDRSTDALLLLFHNAGEIEGVTKIQKLLFLIENETEFGEQYADEISFDFEAYKMGPFSPLVYNEIELLLNMRAIEKDSRKIGPSDNWEIRNYMPDSGSEGLSNQLYKTTSKGHTIGRELEKIIDEDMANELEEIIQKYNSMPLRQLLEYVYTNYENMTSNSEIKEQVLG